MSTVVGITGTIGSGKSTVGHILESLNVPVIDTDGITHELLNQPRIKQALLQRFGKQIGDEGGEVDRKKLGAIVFCDAKAKRDLESIVHPEILLEMRRQIRANSGAAVIAVLVPLLFEAGIASEFDEVWTVIADEDALRNRLAARDKMTEQEIAGRLSAQLCQQQKAARANHVIDNSGSLQQTRRQVELLLSKITPN